MTTRPGTGRRRPRALPRILLGIALVAVVAAAVLGVLALVGSDGSSAEEGPVVAVQDDHLPVDPVETLPGRLDLIARTGATTTRVDLFWRDLAPERPVEPTDPEDPAYDFARADLILRGLAERGITPIVSVYNTPTWATGGLVEPADARVNTLAPSAEDFAGVMQVLARRYSGTYRVGDGAEPLPAVRHWELWNEPNQPGFLRPQVRDGARFALDRYAAMVKAAYPRMKRVSPDSVVIAGVGGPRGLTDEDGTGAFDWLRGLRERRIPLDAYSQHIYPAAGPLVATEALPSWSSVGPLLSELDRFRPGLPLYITEAGYTTAATPFRDVFVTEEQQAEYLDQIFGGLEQLRDPRVRAVVWFNLQDNEFWPAGLLRADGSEKPSYDGFRDATAASGDKRLG